MEKKNCKQDNSIPKYVKSKKNDVSIYNRNESGKSMKFYTYLAIILLFIIIGIIIIYYILLN
jgi:cytochrome b subunit of formate dehydrogenase